MRPGAALTAALLAFTLAPAAQGCRGCSEPSRPDVDGVAPTLPAPAADATSDPAEDTAPAAATWQTLAPEGGGFTVEFPDTPLHETQRVTSGTGVEVDLHQYRLSEELTGRMLMVSYNPLVGQLVDFGDPSQALAELVEDQKSGPRRRLVSERPLERDGHRGHELVMVSEDLGNDKMQITWQVFIVGYRLYQLMATAADDASQEQAARFVASFRLLAEPGAPLGAEDKKDLWLRHAAPEGDFEVALPVAPERTLEPVETPWGRREVRTFRALSAFPPALYTITSLSLSAAEQKQPLSALYGTWEAFTLRADSGSPLTLEERAAVPIAGRTARALRVSARHGDHPVIARYLGLYTGDRFFELGFLPLDAQAGPIEAARFFDSFRLLAPDRP